MLNTLMPSWWREDKRYWWFMKIYQSSEKRRTSAAAVAGAGVREQKQEWGGLGTRSTFERAKQRAAKRAKKTWKGGHQQGHAFLFLPNILWISAPKWWDWGSAWLTTVRFWNPFPGQESLFLDIFISTIQDVLPLPTPPPAVDTMLLAFYII